MFPTVQGPGGTAKSPGLEGRLSVVRLGRLKCWTAVFGPDGGALQGETYVFGVEGDGRGWQRMAGDGGGGGATRVSVESKTCLLEQQNDPTQLRTPSPRKLVKSLVENGEHVGKGQAFAEVEVMMMYVPLLAQEDGHVQLI